MPRPSDDCPALPHRRVRAAPDKRVNPGDSMRLRVVRAGIDTYQQAVVYMHRDCEVCRSEGFAALTRLHMRVDGREIMATLNVVVGDLLPPDAVALSEAAWLALQPAPGAMATFHHPEPARSSGSCAPRCSDNGSIIPTTST